MNNGKVLLYGIGGAEKAYAVLGYFCIFPGKGSATAIWAEAARLKARNPSIKQVFVIDDRYNLKRDYEEAKRLNSIESHMLFKDILEREGHEIFIR